MNFYHSTHRHYCGIDLHAPASLNVLKTIPGVGRILALTTLYEVGDIQRFESVQKFAFYARLVKCKAESAGKVDGTQGNKIGNAHLKQAFSLMGLGWPLARPKNDYCLLIPRRLIWVITVSVTLSGGGPHQVN